MVFFKSSLIVLLYSYCLVDGRSLRHHNAEHTNEMKNLISTNFIGEATNDLSTAMLQESLNEDGNYVFSPLGYSTILAILAEGARGETRAQLASSLHLPEDLYAVRQAYKSLLTRMKDKGENKPEFKNWFYAYKNYSVESQYREILFDNYLTEVKAVEFEYDENTADEDLLSLDKKKDAIKEISKEEIKENPNDESNKIDNINETKKGSVEEIKKEDRVDDKTKNDTESTANLTESNKQDGEKNEKNSMPSDMEQNYMESDSQKITEANPPEEITTEKSSAGSETNEQKENKESNDKEQIFEKENSVEPSQKKVDSTRKGKGKRYFLNKDTVTALTANRLSSSKKSSDVENTNKRIIIFNGFYHKGNWSVQFHAKNDDSPEGKTFFYTSETDKTPAKMMTTVGEFEIGQIPDLESTALEVPYEGNKYSLLVLLPNSRNGLKKLAANLQNFPLSRIDKYLSKKEVQVCLPKVNFYTISKPKAALLKAGVKDLFDSSADLSGINSDGGLYLDELVQLVTMNFEETSAATNFLTSSLIVTRSNSGPDQFNANHPFFFFLRDRQDGIILAAGKLQDPTKATHEH